MYKNSINNNEYKKEIANRVFCSIKASSSSNKDIKNLILKKYGSLFHKNLIKIENINKTINITPIDTKLVITKEYKSFKFKVSLKDFFKVWIKNLIFLILTLFLYYPLAKIEEYKYLASNILLDGANFQYKIRNKKLLLFYFIILISFFLSIFFIIFFHLNNIYILISICLFLPLIFYLKKYININSLHYLKTSFIYKGNILKFYYIFLLFIAPGIIISFFFIFEDRIKDSLEIFSFLYNDDLFIIWISIFIILSLIFYYAFVYKKYKEMIVNKIFYKNMKFNFYATYKDILFVFFKLTFFIILIGVFLLFISPIFTDFNFHFNKEFILTHKLNFIILFFLYLFSFAFLKGLVEGELDNMIIENTNMKDCSFKSEINSFKLAFIYLINYILIVISLGILYPLAKIRYLKYKIENIYFYCDNSYKF